MQRNEGAESKLVICRQHFLKLLACPKPLRDQLLIELPALEALRSGEVSSLRVEYVDFERGDLQVLDSKKNELLMVPLDPTVAVHLAEYIQQEGLREGILIQPLPYAPHTGHKPGSKTQGVGLSINAIEWTWKKWCRSCSLPPLTPRMGRAYKACSMLYGFSATTGLKAPKKSIVCIMNFLRHDDIQSTEHYVSSKHMVNYEDFKAEFYEGLKSPFSSGCARTESCPVSCEDCHCKFYQARIEVQNVSGAPLLRSP
jgi:integrase